LLDTASPTKNIHKWLQGAYKKKASSQEVQPLEVTASLLIKQYQRMKKEM